MGWEERLGECEGFQWNAGNSAKIWDRRDADGMRGVVF